MRNRPALSIPGAAILFVVVTAAIGCGSSAAPAPDATPGGTSPPAAGAARGRAPYQTAAGAGPHEIEIQVDVRAAQAILEALSRAAPEPGAAKTLLELPAVRLAVEDSTRTPDVFERDLAAAFEEEAKSAVFDFRSIRTDRERWQTLVAALPAQTSRLAGLAARRAAVLLPTDRPIAAQLQVYLSFGLAGLADHLVVIAPDGREAMIVDLARALGDSAAHESVESQIERVARLVSGQAYRQAWRSYRSASPNWSQRDPSLGPLEPLLQIVSEQGPVAVFHVDENFFPLSVWLKDPMKRTIAQLNRTAERLVEAEQDLEARMALASEIRRSDFAQRVAGPAGAFLCDGIIQNAGIEAFRRALEGGPKAFFAAYDDAQQKSKDLIPLSDAIRSRVKGNVKG